LHKATTSEVIDRQEVTTTKRQGRLHEAATTSDRLCDTATAASEEPTVKQFVTTVVSQDD